MAMSNLSSVLVQRHIAHNTAAHAEAEHIADAGIYQAIQYLTQPVVAGVAFNSKRQFEVEFSNRKIDISIEDERGKIDLNTASEDLITGLLVFLKIDEKNALLIAEKIRELRRNKIEKTFKSKQQIVNLSPHIFEKYNCIKSYITVYSSLNNIESSVSKSPVMNFLKWADDNRWNNKKWIADPLSLKSAGSVMRPSNSYSGYAFTVNAKVAVSNKISLTRTAIIRLTGNRENPFWVHEWMTENSTPKNKRQENNGENVQPNTCQEI